MSVYKSLSIQLRHSLFRDFNKYNYVFSNDDNYLGVKSVTTSAGIEINKMVSRTGPVPTLLAFEVALTIENTLNFVCHLPALILLATSGYLRVYLM